MSKLLKVGAADVGKARGFVFDGCHKFYVCRTETEVRQCRKEGDTVHGMGQLERMFATSCPLRFINWLGDLTSIVPQFANRVKFTYDTGESTVKFRLPPSRRSGQKEDRQ